MLTVIPFRAGGKSRLPEELRREVALAMLGDVVEAAASTGDVRVVTSDAAGRLVATDLGAEVPPESVGALSIARRFQDPPRLLVLPMEEIAGYGEFGPRC